MGLQAILGGALQGLGAGIATQGQNAERERQDVAAEERRRQTALENLRAAADLNDRNAANSDARRDMYGARETARSTDAQVVVAKERGKIEGGLQRDNDRRDLIKSRVASLQRIAENAADKALTAQVNAITASAANNEIEKVVEGDGQSTVFYKDGRQPQVVTTPGSRASGSSKSAGGAGSVYEQLQAGGGDEGAPAARSPAARVQPREPEPARPKKVVTQNGVARFGTAADADAFYNDPGNKGKRFIGPDGKLREVR